MTTTQPARGMRDYLPGDVRRRDYVVEVIRGVYEAYGFEPLETPALENIETLMGKYGEEGNQLIFKVLKRGEGAARGEVNLALRYDLTVPLARVVAEHQATLPKFFKRYQIQPVWRADRPARGRFREFYQCDIDAIGSRSVVVEVELMAAVSDVLARLGFADFVIRVNDRRLLTALLEHEGVPEAAHMSALVALDKLDKIGPERVAAELVTRGIAPSVAAGCLALLGGGFVASPLETLAHLREMLGVQPVLAELEHICQLSAATAVASRLRIDPSLARGLSYYTGAIMEIAVPDLAGSLGGGGRYNHLIGTFLGREIPACGFSLGFERLLVVMNERAMFPRSVAGGGPDVMVALWSDEGRSEALALASELRGAELRVDLYPEADKLAKQFKYAASRDVPFVALVGDEERLQGSVAVKDMRTAVQRQVPRGEAAAFLKSNLNG